MSSEGAAERVGPGSWRLPRRRFLVAGLVAVALAVVVIVLVSGSGSAGAVTSNEVQIKRQLIERLHQHALDPHWVACVPNGRSFEGAAVIRCNVDYGDPHVEAICGVLRGGKLLTDHDEAAIPCGPDLRGWHPLIHTYG
ncbi:MAG TPA: hypothetical protein VMF55_11575 [Solirubrobacterales bacterium]|nr:hypothetical protein [Solirubrobacterales bacterium]